MYHESDYKGCDTYSIDCTGDVVTGDQVSFERATFTGSFRNAKFSGFERISGTVINDSYGQAKQQHTFIILLQNGDKLCIKGRNLYKNGTYRKPWANESDRNQVADEKHTRGAIARNERANRLEGLYS